LKGKRGEDHLKSRKIKCVPKVLIPPDVLDFEFLRGKSEFEFLAFLNLFCEIFRVESIDKSTTILLPTTGKKAEQIDKTSPKLEKSTKRKKK
jgi:hypothetical protein